jgi:hypothetical protein
VTLDAEDVEAIARRVADLIRFQPESAELVDARELAGLLGVRRGWVYAHARELGGVRLGDGPKARLRFEITQAREALSPRIPVEGAPSEVPNLRRSPKRRQQTRDAWDANLIQGRRPR